MTSFSWWESIRSRAVLGLEAILFVSLTAGLTVGSTFFPARRIHFLMRLAGRIMVLGAGIRLSVRGLEHLPRDRGYLLVSNHVNMFDPMIMYAVVPRHIVAIEKASHFRWPLYGTMIRRWGNLPVASGDSALSRTSLARAAEMMRQGTPVFIYPEGTRARSGKMGNFKKGGFHLALQARVPLIPVVVKGADRIFLEGTHVIRPGTEEVVFLPPVPLDGYGPDEAIRLAAHVRSLIQEELERPPLAT